MFRFLLFVSNFLFEFGAAVIKLAASGPAQPPWQDFQLKKLNFEDMIKSVANAASGKNEI